MIGSGLQFNRSFNGEDHRFYSAAKARRNVNRSLNDEDGNYIRRAKSDVAVSNVKMKVKVVDEELPVAGVMAKEALPICNLQRFLRAVTPSVPAQYLSKVKKDCGF